MVSAFISARTISESTYPAPGVSTSTSETRRGWTIGIGGEYAFTNRVSAFVEYDYYAFGTRSVAFPVGPVNFTLLHERSRPSLGRSRLAASTPFQEAILMAAHAQADLVQRQDVAAMLRVERHRSLMTTE